MTTDKPRPLDEDTLYLIENSVGESVQEADWLVELVRVYREAKAFDESDDVPPFHRFFALK